MKIKTILGKIYYLEKDDIKKVRHYMIDNELNNNDMAKKLGISATKFSMVLSNIRGCSTELLEKFKDLFGIEFEREN